MSKIEDIIWSPHVNDEFCTFGSELCLYKMKNTSIVSEENTFGNDEYLAVDLKGTYSSLSYQKFISWYPGHDNYHLYLVNTSDKKMQLINWNATTKNFEMLKELNASKNRDCSCLAWNKLKTNHIAIGYTQHRNETTVVVYDMNENIILEKPTSMCTNDTCRSLAWYPSDENILYASLATNTIKIFDLRATSGKKPLAKETKTKYIYNFCIDPSNTQLGASFNEKQIVIWDLRQFNEPLYTFEDSQENISKIQWSHNNSKLGVLYTNGDEMRVYSMKKSTSTNSSIKNQAKYFLDKTEIFSSKDFKFKSFCWKRDVQKENVIGMDVSNKSIRIKMFTSLNQPNITWSSEGDLCYTTINSSKINVLKEIDEIEPSIYSVIKERAQNDYGLRYELFTNGQIKTDFINNLRFNENKYDLRYLWNWFDSVNRLFDFNISVKYNFQEYFSMRYHGLFLFVQELMNRRTSMKYESSSTINDINERIKMIAFSLCEWIYKDGSLTSQFFINLELQNEIERAICLCILLDCSNYNYEDVLEKLFTNDENNYSYLWIVLKCLLNKSSPIDESNIQEYAQLVQQFSNAYLRALFNYILFKEKAIDQILHDANIKFQDRVALAVHFLINKPTELVDYLDGMIKTCIQEVNIHGILLTGLSNRCIDLFQVFVEKTQDIQTVALALIHSSFSDVLESKKLDNWIRSYRDLLDKWKLWSKRAEFDIFRMKLSKSNQTSNDTVNTTLTPKHSQKNLKASQQEALVVKILCNNCGRNVHERSSITSTRVHTTSLSSTSNSNNFFLNPTTTSTKTSSILQTNGTFIQKNQNEVIYGCSHCQQWLPSCTICLKTMSICLPPHGSSNSMRNSVSVNSPKCGSVNSNFKSSPSMPNTLNLVSSNEYRYSNDYLASVSNKQSNWFCYCRSCRHGGHAKCLSQWFTTHEKCPYQHCLCKCVQIDLKQ